MRKKILPSMMSKVIGKVPKPKGKKKLYIKPKKITKKK